jgi:ABC-type multidrug transport system fused ATPase/permease subunit
MIEALKRIDQSQLWYYLVWYNNRWLGVRFDMISTAIVAGTGLVLVTLPPSFATAGFAGFVISSAIRSSNEIIWLIRHITETEVSMVSVERCKEFTELQSEAAAIVEPRPAASWPHAGAISVDTLCVRYAPRLPRVLKNVTFDIRAGEKVGIVGATGSGKTTLSLAFFRFNEAESGSIMIDGVDVSGVGLHDLRSRLTIVPQEPSILSGTVRSTLDPLEDGYSDQEMYDALRRVHLLKTIDSVSTEEMGEGDAGQHTPSFFSNLDSAISEQGRVSLCICICICICQYGGPTAVLS